MAIAYTRSDIERPAFGHAWQTKTPSVHATVRLGFADMTFDSSEEALELAAAIMVAAVALGRLEADPELTAVDPQQVAIALESLTSSMTAAAAHAADVQAAADAGPPVDELAAAAAAAAELLAGGSAAAQ